MLAETASQCIADECAIAKQLRHLRDTECKDGFGHALWKQLAEMGFTGILVGEEDGGMGMGHVEAGIVLEEIGGNLTPSPFLTSAGEIGRQSCRESGCQFVYISVVAGS